MKNIYFLEKDLGLFTLEGPGSNNSCTLNFNQSYLSSSSTDFQNSSTYLWFHSLVRLIKMFLGVFKFPLEQLNKYKSFSHTEATKLNDPR